MKKRRPYRINPPEKRAAIKITRQIFRHALKLNNRDDAIALTLDAIYNVCARVAGIHEKTFEKLGKYKSSCLKKAIIDAEDIPASVLSAGFPAEMYELLLETAGIEDESNLRAGRRHGGVFYTPEILIDRVLALTDISLESKVCDPAMGSGHFLLAVVKMMIKKYGVEKAQKFARNNLYGCDCDPLAVKLCARALDLCFGEHEFETKNLKCADPLLAEPFGKIKFDVVIGNPPYEVLTSFRAHPEKKIYAQKIRECGRYVHSLSGQINLYKCFIERGLEMLKCGGKLSYVVPPSLLKDHRCTGLRKMLLREHGADAFELHQETARPFKGVVQGVVIFRATKGAGQAKNICVKSDKGESVIDAQEILNFSEDAPILCASDNEWKLLGWLSENAPRKFSDIADGYVGEVDQTVFKSCISQNSRGAKYLRGMHMSPERRFVDNEFIDEKLFLQKVGRAHPSLRRINRPRVAQLGIRNMDMSPRLLAVSVEAGVYLGNSLNCWLPKNGVKLKFIEALLNSSLYDWRFCLGSSNNNINVCEIRDLPLPQNMDEEKVDEVVRAFNEYRKSNDLSRVNECVCELFGVPDEHRKTIDNTAKNIV